MVAQAYTNQMLRGDLDDPSRLAFVFCSAVIALDVDYKEEFKEYTEGPTDVRRLYLDAENIFLAGLLKTNRGSCVSMPMLYLVIGERLGYPLHLVGIGQHNFLRWEQLGYRMNIETTITEKVAMTPDEDIYLEAEQLTREQLEGTDDLKNMSKRDIVGLLLYTRCGWYRTHLPQYEREYLRDLNRAHYLLPNNRNVTLHWNDVNRRLQQIKKNDAILNRQIVKE